MWVLFARAPPPDAPYWPGRRWLAAVDAVAWPGTALVAIGTVLNGGGLVLAVVASLLLLSASRRLVTALFANHRYQFTTFRWGRVLVWTMMFGALLKLGFAA